MAWSDYQPAEAVWRRAGARRHYNSLRRDLATLRREQLAELVTKHGLGPGSREWLARKLDVSVRTIVRDLRVILGEPQRCPCCRQRIAARR